jgi:uncharacterized membrane protein YbhN (UPF0104 family)
MAVRNPFAGPRLKWSVALGGLALAGFLLFRTLARYSFADLRDAVAAVPANRIFLAIGFAAASYLCLTLFDVLGLRYARKPLPYWKAALTSFTALSLGHNIGLAALSSGAVRYRFYARWGLTAQEVAKVILFCATTVGFGLMILGGIALIARPESAQAITGVPRAAAIALGTVCLVLPLIYLALTAYARNAPALHIFSWSFALPTPSLALAQLVVGPLNFAFVAACLYQALTAVSDVSYPDVAIVYAIANATTLISHAPGGVGVVEWVVTSLVPGAHVVGAALVFRSVYYFLPLCLGAVALSASEIIFKKPRLSASSRSD